MSTLAPTQFQRISTIAQSRWGLCLTQAKLPLVSNRLASFLRGTEFGSVDAYLDYLEESGGEEDMLVFFDILSTNVTSFFRDRPHFDYLEREFYTPLARGNLTTIGKKVRVWSAACSTGQEPYSLAMHAMEHLPNLRSWDFKILATDLSNFAVEQATAGTYSKDKLADIEPELVAKYFVPRERGGNEFTVSPEVRSLVTVRRMNLMDPWPIHGPFDVIFCRNVMIYFDAPTRLKLIRRFYDLLRPGGIFAVGSAETLAGLDTRFTPVQPSMYVRP